MRAPPRGPTLHDVGESHFLTLLRRRIGRLAPSVVLPRGQRAYPWQVAIGDDAAILAGKHTLVVGCDMLIEDVDFRRTWATWQDVGHKAAAVNLSDLAAMGATPAGLIVALAASPQELCEDMLQLLGRCHKLGHMFGAPLVGGDLSQTRGPVVVSVTALGVAPRRPVLRHQGQVGDRIMVTGKLGGAAAGLQLLERPHLATTLTSHATGKLVQRQLRPTPLCLAGQALAASGVVRSMADVSDGLHQDVRHVLSAHTGVVIDADALPVQHGVREVASALGQDPMRLALCGGEDFELVAAVPAKNVARAVAACDEVGVRLTEIGAVTRAQQISYSGHAAPTWRHGQGFRHFASTARARRR